MKRIIQGKTYNTDTAHKVGEAFNSHATGRTDFHYWAETLYRTRKGAYFIYGEGGALSRWSKAVGNMSTWGDGILPLTLGQAQQWAQARGLDGEYIAEWGEPAEAGAGDYDPAVQAYDLVDDLLIEQAFAEDHIR